MNLAAARGVTLSHEVFNVLFANREFKVARKDGLDFILINLFSISLIEKLETLECLHVFSSLSPPVTDYEADDFEVNRLLGEYLRVSTFQVLVNVSLGHAVEAEVVKNVSEVCN